MNKYKQINNQQPINNKQETWQQTKFATDKLTNKPTNKQTWLTHKGSFPHGVAGLQLFSPDKSALHLPNKFYFASSLQFHKSWNIDSNLTIDQLYAE